jgi:hypothetical protein
LSFTGTPTTPPGDDPSIDTLPVAESSILVVPPGHYGVALLSTSVIAA